MIRYGMLSVMQTVMSEIKTNIHLFSLVHVLIVFEFLVALFSGKKKKKKLNKKRTQ